MESVQFAEPATRRAGEPAVRRTTIDQERVAKRPRSVGRFSAEAREKLILDHLPLVKHVLGRVASRLPAHVDRSDLLEAGTLGLIDAADRFDPRAERALPHLRHVADPRSMLDALRADDWLPRSVRSELGRVARISAKIEQESSRAPTSAEICSRAGWKPRTSPS